MSFCSVSWRHIQVRSITDAAWRTASHQMKENIFLKRNKKILSSMPKDKLEVQRPRLIVASLYLSLSVSFSLFLSPFLSLSLSPCLYLSFSFYLPFFHFLCLPVCIFLSLYISISFTFFVSLSVSFFLF